MVRKTIHLRPDVFVTAEASGCRSDLFFFVNRMTGRASDVIAFVLARAPEHEIGALAVAIHAYVVEFAGLLRGLLGKADDRFDLIVIDVLITVSVASLAIVLGAGLVLAPGFAVMRAIKEAVHNALMTAFALVHGRALDRAVCSTRGKRAEN